jgi:hypothetical protein
MLYPEQNVGVRRSADVEETSRPDSEPTPEPAGSGGAPPVVAPPAAAEAAAPPPGGPRKGLIAVVVAVAVVALVALGVAGWMYYETTTTQRAAVELLEQATVLVERADAVVLDLDEIVRAEIDSEMATTTVEVAEAVPGAVDDLEEALALIDESLEDLPDDEIAYARALQSSARARLEMLEQADPILEANEKAAIALGPATRAWALVLESNDLSRQAVAEYNKLTRESVTRSAELTAQSTAKATEAKALFSEAATGFPEADLSMYVAYTDAKLAALAISKQADEAFLGNRPAEANTLGDRFNEAERALAEKARELPESPAVPIAAAYEELAGAATDSYLQARARATEADARLREVDGRANEE